MRAAVLPAALLTAAVLAACDGGVTEPPFLPESSPAPTVTAEPSPTPQATPSPPATPVPGSEEDFGAFAGQIQTAVEARNPDLLADAALIATVVCPNEFVPRCEGQPEGSEILGVNVGYWRSEGTVVEAAQFRQDLAAYLDSLAQPALYAIGRRASPLGAPQDPAFFAVAVSADDPENTTRVFEFIFSGGAWRMSLELQVSALADEWLSGDCSECYDHWERWEGNP